VRRSSYLKRRAALNLLAGWPLGFLARHANAASPAERRQAEALSGAEFTDAHGNPHTLNELTRPLALVNLWASCCAGCRTELPTIRELTSRLGPNALDVVLLSHDLYWRDDTAYARENGLPFPHWRLSSRTAATVAAAAFRLEADSFGLPQSAVFAGRARNLVWSQMGSTDWMAPDQLRLLRTWLGAAG
jgi:thiol-disulfide isomerase/thioredoxin